MSNLEPKVFISHSSIDDSVTRDLEDWLTRLGFVCWVYYQDPDPNYRRSIQRAIETHDFFLLVSSRNAYEKSIEVEPEILWAHKHRRQICIYKLDDYVFPAGIAYLLSKTKWVEANTHGADAFASLAMQMLTSLGLENDAINQRIIKIKTEIKTQQEEEAKRKKLQLEKYLDKLWTYRYDDELQRSRTLNALDKIKLNRHGDELGISEEDRIKFQRRYKRDLRSFKTAISRALSSNRIDRRDIKGLEQTRLECCIPLEEATKHVQALLRNQDQTIGLTKGAAKLDSWLVALIINSQSNQFNPRVGEDFENQVSKNSDFRCGNEAIEATQKDTSISMRIGIDETTLTDSKDKASAQKVKPQPNHGPVSTRINQQQPLINRKHETAGTDELDSPQPDNKAKVDTLVISKNSGGTRLCISNHSKMTQLTLSDKVILDEVFLGKHISSYQIREISFKDNEFKFVYDDNDQTRSLYSTRHFTVVSVYSHKILMKQEGCNNYYRLHINRNSPDFLPLHEYLRCCGLTVIFRDPKVIASHFRQKVDGSMAPIEGATNPGSQLNNKTRVSEFADNHGGSLQLPTECETVKSVGSLIDELQPYVSAIRALKLNIRLDKLCQIKSRMWERGAVSTKPFSIEPKLVAKSTLPKAVSQFSKGAVLLCFIDSRIGAKRGIIVFERGFEIADDANADFFLFGHPDVSPECMVSIGIGKHGSTELTVRGYSLKDQAIISRAFIFKSPLLSRLTDFRLGLIDLFTGLNMSHRMIDQLRGRLFERIRGLATSNLVSGCIGPTSLLGIDDQLPRQLSSFANGGLPSSSIIFFMADSSALGDLSCLAISVSGIHFRGQSNAKFTSNQFWPWSEVNYFKYTSLRPEAGYVSFSIMANCGTYTSIWLRMPSFFKNNPLRMTNENASIYFNDISAMIMGMKNVFAQLQI